MTENRLPENRIPGRFVKGVSGNPGGRSKAMAGVRERFKEIMPSAVDELDRLIHDPKTKAADKVAGIRLAAEYSLGKAPVAVNLEVQQTFETPEARQARIRELMSEAENGTLLAEYGGPQNEGDE